MSDFGALILPVDLVSTIADAGPALGWLGGRWMESERVYLVSSAQIGSKGIVSKYSSNLDPHRSWDRLRGTYNEKLLPWRKIAPQSLKDYHPQKKFSVSEIASELTLSNEDLRSERRRICLIEPGTDGPTARGFAMLVKKDSCIFVPMDTILAPATPEPYPRLPSSLTEVLRDKAVAIVGLGSGGGDIAMNLACAGVKRLFLFDHDRLHSENYLRHALTKRDLGRLKTEGIKDIIKERDLPADVIAVGKGVVAWADEFRDNINTNRPDLMICATDTRESRRFMNLCSIALKTPLVIAGFLGAGRIGEVILVRPGVSACYECIRLALGAALEVPETEGQPPTPYLGSEEPDLQSAVQRFDIGFLSSIVARAALQLLDPKTYPPLPTDYLAWGREALSEFAPQFSFELPLTLNYVPIPRRSDCPACGESPADLKGIDIDGRYFEILAAFSNFSA